MTEYEYLEKTIQKSLDILYRNKQLFECDKLERDKVFHFAFAFMNDLKKSDYKQYDIDVEYYIAYDYNEYGKKNITIDNKKVSSVPDMIIHKRGSKNNLAVFEFKCTGCSRSSRYRDYKKLREYTAQDKKYKYKYGFYVELSKERKDVFIKIFENGKVSVKEIKYLPKPIKRNLISKLQEDFNKIYFQNDIIKSNFVKRAVKINKNALDYKTYKDISNFKFEVRYNEDNHNIPHFHVTKKDGKDISINIATGSIIKGEKNFSSSEKENIEKFRESHINDLIDIWNKNHIIQIQEVIIHGISTPVINRCYR